MEKQLFVYVSCWDNLGGAPGLGLITIDSATGNILSKKMIREDVSLGFSMIDPQKKILYVCEETENQEGYFQGGGGRIFAYSINTETGDLTELSAARTFCPNPCYLTLDKTGKFLLAANHSAYNACTKIVKDTDGNYTCVMVFDDSVLEVFALNNDGSLSKIVDVDHHDEPAKGRAQHSHPQSIKKSPSGNFFISTDVGEHKIYSYIIDPDSGKLSVINVYKDAPKSKPRYCVFHPELPYLYVNYEGRKELNVFRYYENGRIEYGSSVSGVPEDVEYPEGKGQSGLVIDQNGEFIYGLMTATAAVCTYHVDQKTGIPELVQYLPTNENKLRSLSMSPDGRFLFTTCIQSGSIDVYRITGAGTVEGPIAHEAIKGAAFTSSIGSE